MLNVAVLIICHGRSGSTLLEEAVSLAGLNNYFEPLDKIRNPLPSTPYKDKWGGSCMEDENNPSDVKCPVTDSLMVANLLRCRIIMNAGIILGQREASVAASSIARSGGSWDVEDYSSMYGDAIKDEAKCYAKSSRGGGCLVKAIRLNGHLGSFLSVWNATGAHLYISGSGPRANVNNRAYETGGGISREGGPRQQGRRQKHIEPASMGGRNLRARTPTNNETGRNEIGGLRVVQLIRDPRGLIASRLRLGW